MVPTTSSTATTHDVLTLGETMWRLSPSLTQQRLEAATTLDIHVGGAESNTAIALARLGKRAAWWSRLPETPPGRHVAAFLRAQGVDVGGVRWGEGRLGTYYVEFGGTPRPTQVIYDRAHSAASQMQPDDFDWERLSGARWLHLTGITPALSASCLGTVRCAIAEARQRSVPVSFDLNYRAKLWTPAQAAPVLDELAAQASMVIAAERDVKLLFHLSGKPDALLPNLHARWNQAAVVLTHGAGGSTAFDGSLHHAPAVLVSSPIAIGAGDAFDAGLLDALLDGKPLPEALRQGNALAALKLTIPGDVALVTRLELDALLASAASGVLR